MFDWNQYKLRFKNIEYNQNNITLLGYLAECLYLNFKRKVHVRNLRIGWHYSIHPETTYYGLLGSLTPDEYKSLSHQFYNKNVYTALRNNTWKN